MSGSPDEYRPFSGGGTPARPWAVVTGASSGIGEALARGLAAHGHPLWLVARRGDVLERLAKELRAAHGVDIEISVCDLADRGQRARLRDALAAVPVAVLCNNAGFPTCGALTANDPAREIEEVEVNVAAVHDLTLAVLPGMVERRCGAILFTGSTAGVQPVPTAATYAASKAFVNSFAEALHEEMAGTGVTCTLLAPGPVRSEFSAVGGIGDIESTRWFAWKTPERVAGEALAGLKDARRVVVPGAAAKSQAFFGRYLPRPVAFWVMRAAVLPTLRSSRRTTS
ncbi:SDR family oxidoreductase [Frankia sp. CiP3]|uniref:SDR family NAD(P)-dependent oxidoreductase n=1 Tax=Frankia sp. CiP3 TaxID=2880971 RepID=UPI001EF4EBDF|nr:SDR family oxidoreductase [Frankia sp. CiP3]